MSTEGKLYEIWKEINISLSRIGLRFTDFDEFKDLANLHEGFFISRFVKHWFNKRKKEIKYEFLKGSPNNYICPVDHKGIRRSKINFSKYIFSSLDDNKIDCICQYKRRNEAQSYIRSRLYKHINWENIIK